jgi:hypothetical protein
VCVCVCACVRAWGRERERENSAFITQFVELLTIGTWGCHDAESPEQCMLLPEHFLTLFSCFCHMYSKHFSRFLTHVLNASPMIQISVGIEKTFSHV